MLAQLVVAFIVVAFDGGLLQRPIHALDLPVRPRMIRLGQAMLDAVFAATHVEHVRHASRRRTVAVLGEIGELNAVVGQNGVDFIRNRLDQRFKEGSRGQPVGLALELGEGNFGRAVNRHEKIELSLFGSDLGNVDVKEADRIGLKLFLVRLVAFDLRQPADPVTLQTSMQRRTGQIRDRSLQCIETIVERKQSVLSKGDNDRLLLEAQHGR